MPRGRTCKFGRNSSTGKCNRDPARGSPKARGRPCKYGRNSTGKCNKKNGSVRKTQKVSKESIFPAGFFKGTLLKKAARHKAGVANKKAAKIGKQNNAIEKFVANNPVPESLSNDLKEIVGKIWEVKRINYVVPTIVGNKENNKGEYAIESVILVNGGKNNIQIEFSENTGMGYYINGDEFDYNKEPINTKLKGLGIPVIDDIALLPGDKSKMFSFMENDEDHNNKKTEDNLNEIRSGVWGKYYSGLMNEENYDKVWQDVEKAVRSVL